MEKIKFYKPLMLLILLGFTWGTGYSIARFAMTNGVNPLAYSFWQSLGPAIIITVFTLLLKEKISFSPSHCRYYFICGLTGIALPNTNMYFAAPHLPAGLLAVVVNTVPIMAYVLALFAGVEKFNRVRLTAVFLALSGLLLIVYPNVNLNNAPEYEWIFSALATPFCFAFCSVYINKYRPKESTVLSVTSGTLIFSTLLLAPVVWYTGNFYLPHTPFTMADAAIFLSVILSSLGFVLFFKLIRMAGAVYYSFVDTIVAITGLFWGYMVFNERLNIATGIAVFLIIISLILVTKNQRAVIKSQTIP